MAKNTSLYFRIVEGRNLPAKDVSGTSDPYCIVKVDSEIVARTATVWKNLNPFWGEEYTLHLPTGFHTLSLYVMDEDTIGHDDVIGKISLSKEAIASQSKGLDGWLSLRRVEPDEEVQGDVHLSLELQTTGQRALLRCDVIEARDLAPRDISGTSDPFARVLFNNHSAETSIIKKTRFPHWGEQLELELEPRELTDGGSLTLEIWDWDMVGKNDFLGKVEIPLSCLLKSPLQEGWFRLMPLRNAEDDAGGKLGAVRLKVRLIEDQILPSMCYQPLVDLLVESVIKPVEVDDVSPLTMLEEVTMAESRQDVAMTLVKIYLGQGLVVPFLDYLNMREVNHTSDPNTLFRSNSLASKAMEQFMKAVGMLYLHEVLKPILNRIFEEKKYVELDPCKIELNRTRRISFKGVVSEAEVLESSVEVLQGYLLAIMDAIVGSLAQCPIVMRVVFKQLHKRVEEQFPGPAHEAVQSIGNLGLQLGQGKEQWMAPLHPVILSSVGSFRDFLDKLIDVDCETVSDRLQRAPFLPSVTLKEGYLHKRKTEGPQLLTRFAFKKRYFWLNSESLSYAKSPDWQVGPGVRSSIPMEHVCAVERVDENAFQLQHVMQVLMRDGDGQTSTMYLQCKNVNELNQWLSAIRKASIETSGKLPSYHPGTHRGGRWTCCLQSDRAAHGCSRTHSAVTLGDWSDPLDPDAEAQTIYKHLLQGRDALRERYLELPDDDAGRKHLTSSQSSDDTACAMLLGRRGQAVASRLLAMVLELERAHLTFQQREAEEAINHIMTP
ncbi:rasGAP-activating-like protein 1 isoform X3 [Brienomyrus brachyistius]|uniref:rasGAP-activating-like protein 1 isoform X3 n=1 Tax=Brienomyrus brachyistius TaxID=42636 RepID=UPI0020B456B9|nr:rasGAP-activating-like protein 1 isoform X3 [Brienomyrus brachyistius]